MKSKTIQLSAPVIGLTGEISHLVIREPTAGEFLEGGQLSGVYQVGGAEAMLELPSAFRFYLERCITNLANGAHAELPVLLLKMDLADGFRIRRALTSLFNEAAKRVTDLEAAAAKRVADFEAGVTPAVA